MKKYTTNQLRRIALAFSSVIIPDEKYAKKYNSTHSIDIINGKESMGGRAWVMWFLDEIDHLNEKEK